MKINQTLKDVLFGVALGGFMCMTTAIYFNKGENPVISEDTTTAVYMLHTLGMVFGVMMSRNGFPVDRKFTFLRAFGVAYLIMLIASIVYGVYINYVYMQNPDLIPVVKEVLATNAEAMFANDSELQESYKNVMLAMVTPAFLGSIEASRVLTATLIPAIVTALFFRRKARVINS